MSEEIARALEKGVRQDLVPAIGDTEKAVTNAIHSVADGAGNVANLARTTERDATARIEAVGRSAGADTLKSAEKTAAPAGAARGKIAGILDPQGSSATAKAASEVDRWPASGPMRPEQEPAVRDALDRLKMQPKDKEKILAGLAGRKTPMGADAAELIGRGHLEGADGYRDVLSQFKDGNSRPAAMMSLRHADDLYGQGQRDLLFEMKEQPGQPHFDIDVGTRADGVLDAGYQLKDVQGVAGLASASKKAALQLVDAPAHMKVALMDVHAASTELDPAAARSIAREAANFGVTFHLRFSDGRDLTIPPGAPVYPGDRGN